MPPKEKKTKEQIAKAAAAGSKGKKKKWSKGKVRDKLNNLVLFDKATLDKFNKEVCLDCIDARVCSCDMGHTCAMCLHAHS